MPHDEDDNTGPASSSWCGGACRILAAYFDWDDFSCDSKSQNRQEAVTVLEVLSPVSLPSEFQHLGSAGSYSGPNSLIDSAEPPRVINFLARA